jgi:hypothetical protein
MMSSHEMLNDRKVDVPGDELKAETAPRSNDNLTVKEGDHRTDNARNAACLVERGGIQGA